MNEPNVDSTPDSGPVRSRRRFCLVAAGTTVGSLGATLTHAAEHAVGHTARHAANDKMPSDNRQQISTLSIAGVGATLRTFRVDETQGELHEAGSLDVPAAVQYAWRHPRLPLLYVAYSNGSPTSAGDHHGLATLHLQADGTMTEAFAPVPLPNRPINVTVSPDGRHALVAYNAPSGITVHALTPHGRPGPVIAQQSSIDAGIYAHQVRVTPDGKHVLLVTRGNDATATRAEDPGAIKQFDFRDGQLRNERSIALHGGFGFGPRHLDFHPTKPWVFLSLERENQMMVFALHDGQLADTPMFTVSTVRDSAHQRPRQLVAAIHVSGDGRFVYVSNRADHVVAIDERQVFDGGENSMTVFGIDQHTGAPTRLQSIDTNTFNPRTFSLTPDGHLLISGAIESMIVRDGDGFREVPAGLTVFRIGADGRMTLASQYAIQTGGKWIFWSGTVAVSA